MVRQFQSDPSRPDNGGGIPLQSPMNPMGPGGVPFLQPSGGAPGVISGPPQPFDPRILSGGPPGLLPPAGMLPPGGPGMPMDMISGPVLHPGAMLGPQSSLPGPFISFDGMGPGPAIGYEPISRGPPPPDYSSNPVLYNQSAPIPQSMQAPSPQPVPAPGAPVMYPIQSQSGYDPHGSSAPHSSYRRHRSPSPIKSREREDRMKTPEPPIISDYKVINFNLKLKIFIVN